jgi:hypothetical protein
MLKSQLFLSIVTAGITIIGIFVIVPRIGIVGAGIALLIAELFAAVAVTRIASRWMMNTGLQWPKGLSGRSLLSIIISSSAIFLITFLPQYKWTILVSSIVLLFWNVQRFWSVLPEFAKEQAKRFVSRLPGVKNLLTPKVN